MALSREQLREAMDCWGRSWDAHDIDGVMELFHEEIYFEHWTGTSVEGHGALRAAWTPWFREHGGFRFTTEDLFIDEEQQKVLYQWQLDWPSQEQSAAGKPERRWGVDVVHFRDGKIIRKLTYIKTQVDIAGKKFRMAVRTE
jgi:ketosteroid isomerase-like protein